MVRNTSFIIGNVLPTIALRGISIFPGSEVQFDVGRPKSIAALQFALKRRSSCFMVAQKNPEEEDPTYESLYKIGTVCRIKSLVHKPGEDFRVQVEGLYRATIDEYCSDEPFISTRVERVEDTKSNASLLRTQSALQVFRSVWEEYLTSDPHVSPDLAEKVAVTTDAGSLSNYLAQNLPMDYRDQQKFLAERRPYARLEMLCDFLSQQMQVNRLANEIQAQASAKMEKEQRDYFIREQIHALRAELGEGEEDAYEEYREKILALQLPEESREKLLKEAAHMARQPAGSPDTQVIRTWLDTCLELPWNVTTEDKADLDTAESLLNATFYGMEKVKERILEFLAVRKLNPSLTGQVICLAGPPGTGKTSIGQTIAEAVGRKFARVSLGGMRDEADIRGHRKTYVGAMPGRIIDAVRRAGSRNPVILLDEIDKMASDVRGDPASAMLEVLDTEQNHAFRDHYLELPFDLSQVLFIMTANDVSQIPRPLLDRMELIELSSYTDEEKIEIAKRHLLPRQLSRHGLTPENLRVSDAMFMEIIYGYTRESGVRGLDRELAALCRKCSRRIASGDKHALRVSESNLEKLLGPARRKEEPLHGKSEIGVVTGLAWTSVGGEILPVEVNILNGTGRLELTGNLGEVMKESAGAALNCVRARAADYGIQSDFYQKTDIHIHFPEGAVPKDGPSAGVTIVTALVSALTGRPVPTDLAMTGEITIRGRVSAIGGLREKTMAALRHGATRVILPKENLRDLPEIDQKVRAALQFIPVENVTELLEAALLPETPDGIPHFEGIGKTTADKPND